jgi:putative inorganic carbon (hco3(-)) transporter
VSWLLAVGAGLLAAIGAFLLPPLVVLGLLAGGVLLAASFFRPLLGALVLILTAYTRVSDVLLRQGVPVSVFELLILWLGIVLLARWYLWHEAPEGWPRPALFMGIYLLAGAVTLLYASDLTRARLELVNTVKDVVFVLLVVIALHRSSSLRPAIWTLLLAGIFLSTLSVYQQLSGNLEATFGGFSIAEEQPLAGGTSGYRVGGPMGSPNFFALVLIPLLPLAVDRLWREQHPLLRLLALWASGSMLLAIVFTFSRGGFVALAVVVGLLLWRLRQRPALLLGLALVLVLLLPLAPDTYRERLGTLTELAVLREDPALTTERSIRGRLSEWIVGWEMFRDHPLGGVGVDHYPVHYLDYSEQLGLDNRRSERSPHSLYVEVAAEMGIVGLVAFGALLAALFAGLWYAHNRFRAQGAEDEASLVGALAIGFAGYLVGSLFLHAAYPRFFWTLAAIGFAAPLIAAGRAMVTGARGGR